MPDPGSIHGGGNVLLVAHAQYRAILLGMAERLKAERGANIHLYVSTEQQADHYRKRHPDLFASITVARALYRVCREPVSDEASVIKEAREHEEDLGITINELAVSDRHLGRGFALGGFRHPRSRMSENTSYVQMVNAFNAVIRFWRQELAEKRPTLILNAPKVLCVLARKAGVPVRTLANARYQNLHYWAENEFLERSDFPSKEITAPTAETPRIDSPYAGYTTYRRATDQRTRLHNVMKESFMMVVRQVYWILRGYEKAKGYYLRENIRFLWRRRAAYRQMTRSDLPTLDGLRGTKFVFFPLATEPEVSLQRLSPECFSQLACIAAICRDLPAGYRLVVKEHHTSIGRRPGDFYAQISEFKNATFMHMDEPGFNVVQEAAAVATITGTVGFEAAMQGIPAILFGRHNPYDQLPHVHTVIDHGALKPVLHQALRERNTREATEAGRTYLAALADASFDLEDFNPWNPDEIRPDAVAAAWQALVQSLDRAKADNSGRAEEAA